MFLCAFEMFYWFSLKSVFKSRSVAMLVDVGSQRGLLTGVGGGGCVCTRAVCPVIVSPQTVDDLSKKHLIIHLVRTNIRLLGRQAAAGDQLSEGLKEEQE